MNKRAWLCFTCALPALVVACGDDGGSEDPSGHVAVEDAGPGPLPDDDMPTDDGPPPAFTPTQPTNGQKPYPEDPGDASPGGGGKPTPPDAGPEAEVEDASPNDDPKMTMDGGDGGDADVSDETEAEIEWIDNSTVFDGVPIEYGLLDVPLNYRDPSGTQLQLALARWATPKAKRRGVLMFNPGGPGAGVVEDAGHYVPSLTSLFPGFDIVLVDNRGTGLSTPLECISFEELNALLDADDPDAGARPAPERDPLPPSLRGHEEAVDALYAQGEVLVFFQQVCLSTFSDELGFFNSENVARDMDSVRAVLGEEELNFWGVSYGTVQGALYAKMFPKRVRAVALDSNVLWNAANPNLVQDVELSVAAYEEQLLRFFSWAEADTTSPLYDSVHGRPRQVFDSLVAATAAGVDWKEKPIPADIFEALAFEYLRLGDWDSLALAMADAADDDWDTALALSAGNGFSAEDERSWRQVMSHVMINHLDGVCPADYTEDEAIVRYEQLVELYPRLGPNQAPSLVDCLLWEVPRSEPRIVPRDLEAPPLLVLNGLYDPATPHTNAVAMVDQFHNGSRLFTASTEGHGVGITDCGTAVLSSFVQSGNATAAPQTCASVEQASAMSDLLQLVQRRTARMRLVLR